MNNMHIREVKEAQPSIELARLLEVLGKVKLNYYRKGRGEGVREL